MSESVSNPMDSKSQGGKIDWNFTPAMASEISLYASKWCVCVSLISNLFQSISYIFVCVCEWNNEINEKGYKVQYMYVFRANARGREAAREYVSTHNLLVYWWTFTFNACAKKKESRLVHSNADINGGATSGWRMFYGEKRRNRKETEFSCLRSGIE